MEIYILANNITQVFEEAGQDAQSLQDFINNPANLPVNRRLAPPIKPLSHYEQYMESLSAGKDATITSVTAKSGAAGTEASVLIGGTPSARTFEFTIPKGENASNIYQIRRSYQTYELMVADKANIPANTSIDITNDEDYSENGTYTYDGTSFTKSIHDTQEVLKKAVEDIKQDASIAFGEAIQDYGYVTIDSFEQGATLTQRNQALRHAADGKLYRWAGDLPKVVPVGSTPASSGGLGTNAWLEVSDSTLRQDIVTGSLVTDALTKTVPVGLGGISRNQQSKNSDRISIKDYGAIGDGNAHPVSEWIPSRFADLAAIKVAYPHVTAITDSIDWVAAQAAINTGMTAYAPKPAVAYYFNKPINISNEQSFIGAGGARVAIRCAHGGTTFQLRNKGRIENFQVNPTAEFKWIYDCLAIGEIGQLSANNNLYNIVKNIKAFQPRRGFGIYGGAYWNTLIDIDSYHFRDYGLYLDRPANNNYVRFQSLSSNAVLTPIGSGGGGAYMYTFDEITWEQAAIYVGGAINTIIGGEPAPSKWGVIVGDNASGNRFIGMYMEHQKIPLKTGVGSQTFWDSQMPMGTPDIHPDSIVVGSSGLNNSINTRINTAPIAAGKKAKAIWFFDEGRGNKVFDHSGSGKNLTINNPVWTDDGRWGKTLYLDAARATNIQTLPLDIVDWTQPFTFMACVKSDKVSDRFLLTLTGGDTYSSLVFGDTTWSVVDHNGTDTKTTSGGKMQASSQDGYSWLCVYYDPISKTLSNIDPVIGYNANVIFPQPPRFSPWVTGVTGVKLGSNRSTGGLGGSISFAGFWQRRLTLAEVSDITNMKVPNLFPSAAPMRIENQVDSVAADIPELLLDFNALLDKLRNAGIML